MKKVNILFQSSYEHARMGGQKSLLALLDNLDREVFVPFLTVPYEGELKEIAIKKDIDVLVQPLPGMKPVNYFKLKKIRDRFVNYVKENNISIIHTDNDKFAFLATFIAKKTNSKTIYHARVTSNRKYDKLLEKRVDRIIGISEAVRNRFNSKITNSKFSVIFNGVDCNLFSDVYDKKALQNKLGLDPIKKNLLFVGQIKEGKGLLDIIAAAKLLNERQENVFHFYILGKESDPGNLEIFENRIQEYGLKDNIKFMGQQDKVHEWLQATDILLFPSHEGVEGMGRVPFEAMATGTPVVATNISGVNEAVTDEVGILINQEDPEAMVKAIERLANDNKLYDKLAKAGRKRAMELFDIKIHAKKVMGLYEKMVISNEN
ncbi:MAG: glycosyltransferase family 4 protein [Candidatus Kapaibacterium sp.]